MNLKVNVNNLSSYDWDCIKAVIDKQIFGNKDTESGIYSNGNLSFNIKINNNDNMTIEIINN